MISMVCLARLSVDTCTSSKCSFLLAITAPPRLACAAMPANEGSGGRREQAHLQLAKGSQRNIPRVAAVDILFVGHALAVPHKVQLADGSATGISSRFQTHDEREINLAQSAFLLIQGGCRSACLIEVVVD